MAYCWNMKMTYNRTSLNSQKVLNVEYPARAWMLVDVEPPAPEGNGINYTAQDVFTQYIAAGGEKDRIGHRHADGSNIVFVDAHAEWISIEDGAWSFHVEDANLSGDARKFYFGR